MNLPTFQQLRLQQGGTNQQPIEEIRLSHYRNDNGQTDSMLTFISYDKNGEEQTENSFAISKSDAQLLITHLKINFGL